MHNIKPAVSQIMQATGMRVLLKDHIVTLSEIKGSYEFVKL